MSFNENSRVKIPAILHLHSLGYEYLPLKNTSWDESTNIFTDIFVDNIQKLSPDLDSDEIYQMLEKLNLALDNEDLGKGFYENWVKKS